MRRYYAGLGLPGIKTGCGCRSRPATDANKIDFPVEVLKLSTVGVAFCGVICMQIEERLYRLENRYRAALSAAVVAKCEYFSIVGENSVTEAARQRAQARWQQSEERKRALRVRLAYVEQLGA